ncbi:MAG: 3D domain-containing protein [Armatimonadota bacterium]|nr:3D domain-containing protein [Armatimonadota bacterium]
MRPYNQILGCFAAISFCVAAGGTPVDEPVLTTETPSVIKTEVKEIPYEVLYRFDRALGPGRMEKVRFGENGYLKKTVQYTKRDGKLVDPKLIDQEQVDPKPAVFAIGQAGWESTRGSYGRVRVLTMKSTGYTRFENTNRTAMGLPAKFGVVAVDRRVIKLGTRLYVEGYGYAIAGDTGGAIKGNRIDLCFDEYNQAIRWGRRDVRVHILK